MDDIHSALAATQNASRSLVMLSDDQINQVLCDTADALVKEGATILAANQKDLERMDRDDPKYDRLLLSEARLEGIAKDMKAVADLPSPLNVVLEERDLPNGLHLQKTTVPLGVVGIVYEARPNVTFDAYAITFKSGNAVALKGGSDARDSNEACVKVIHQVLNDHGIDTAVCRLLPPDRSAVEAILSAQGLVDVIIPRGSQGLIDFVRENSKVPAIETGAGICHTYVHTSADTQKAAAIVRNAKVSRPAVCNPLDCLVVDQARLADLPAIVTLMEPDGVIVHADEASYAVLDGHYDANLLRHATDESFGTEWLSLQCSIKVVSGFEEALEHINTYSSKHSEAIVAEDQAVVDEYLMRVDAAAVFSNASTYFTDGAQFGLGAEIGISTQKLHARGPMGLREMTSYKWVLRGDGTIRE